MSKQQLILVRGLPGSGKSTIAKNIEKDSGDWIHLETDMFWYDPDGNYNFDYTRLKESHQWCQNATKTYLEDYFNVVVSNTFTTKKEMIPYFEIAKQFNIIPNIIIATGNFGNIHNVPVDAYQRMKDRFEWEVNFEQRILRVQVV